MKTCLLRYMAARLHPHLKAYIHSVVMTEMAELGPSKAYVWKENLMKQVQTAVLDNLEAISSQQDLEKVIDGEILNIKSEFDRTLDMVGRTLKQVPIEVLKNALPKRQ